MVILVRNEGPQSGTIRIVLTCGNPGTNSGFRRTGRDVRAAALQRQVHRARVQRQRHLAPVEGPCRAQQAKHFGHGQSVVFRQRFAVDGVQYLLASAKCQDHGLKKKTTGYSALTHTWHHSRRIPGVPGSAKRRFFNRGCEGPASECEKDAVVAHCRTLWPARHRYHSL